MRKPVLLLLGGVLTLCTAFPHAVAGTDCSPPVRRTYTLEEAVGLTCNPTGARSGSQTLFDVELNDRGFALARAQLKIRHSGNTDVIHFWNAQVAVGSEEYAMGIGDDVCAAEPVTRTNFGYGELTDGRSHVRVFAYQGANPCTDGAVEILAGSKLDLWIEDGRSWCARRSIDYASHYLQVGFTDNYVWQTHLSPILHKRVNVEGAEEDLLIMSVAEGSPDLCPNTVCDQGTDTLSSEIRLDDVTVDEAVDLLPASQGMGHLVLYHEARRTVDTGFHLIELRVRADFSSSLVRTGGCCGDAAVFIVRN